MSAANIKAGIEISAEVKGEEVVAKLAKTIEEAGIDTAALTERGKELSQTFTRLDKASALAEQFKKLKTQTQEVAAELSRAQAQTASLAREMKANPSKELEKQFKAAAAEAGRLKRHKAELAVETHNTRKALAEAGISTKNLAQEERRLAAESEKARKDLAELNEEAQRLKRLADARITLGLHVDAQARNELQRINRAYAELKQNGNLTKKELKAATAAYERELRRLSQTMDGIPSKQTAISSSISGMGRTMLAAAGVGGGIYAVKEGLQRILETTTEFAAIRSRMEYAFGGAEGAAQQMEWVKGVAAELGLELKSAANGYAQLAAATKNINMSTEATQQVFKGVASAAASMNLSTEETNGVLLALSQIAGKGKVSMEELRGQLGERLTPAMAIAAKSMGVTTAELEKMVENGIAAEDFLPKFGAAMEEAFGGTESASASVNRLKNRLDELMLKFGEAGGISDAYNAVLSDVGAGLDKLEAAMDGLDGALTGSLSDAFVSAYDTAKTGAAEVAHLIETVIGYINEAGNALNTLLGGSGQDFDVLKAGLDGVNILLGAIQDGFAAIGIAIEAFAGAAQSATALVLEGLAKISFGEMAANFERAAADMKASAEKHFGEAEKRALSFESAAVRAAKHSMETEEQRFSRLEAEARTAYQTAADAAVKAAEQAKSAQEAAAKAVGEAQQKAAQEAADAAQKTASAAAKSALKAESEWQKAAVAAGLATEEMAKIRQPLADAGIAAADTAGKVSEIGGAAEAAAQKVRAAFEKIGVDTDAVSEGISAKAKKAFADFQTASETAREQGINDARLIRNGFEQMMGKLQSKAEFAAFREQLAQSGRTADLTREQIKRLNDAAENGASAAKTAYDRLTQAVKDASDPAALQNLSSQAKQAFSDGLITAAQYDQTLAEVKRRSAEVARQSATMGEAAKTAHNEAAAAARSHAEAETQAAQAAQKGAQQQAAAVQGVGQAASGAVRRVTRLHEVFSTQYGNIKLTREEFAALNAEIDRFNVGQPKSMSVSRWIQYQNQLQAVKDGFAAVIRNAEAAGETVSQMARDGTISQQALARATQAAAEATGKLDAVRLSKLHAQIDEARQKLRQMQDEAKEARETLEAELAGLNGDEEAAHELEARRKIEAWKKKAATTSDEGAAAEYRKAAELQEQVYRRQREKREAERQEKQRAAQAQKPDWNALAEPKVDIPAGVADGLINELNRVLEKRDANVADAAVNALIEQLAAGLRRMT